MEVYLAPRAVPRGLAVVQSSPRPLPRGALRRWTPALCAVWAAVQPSRRRALGVYIDQDVEDVCWSELEEQLATVIRERKPEAVIGFAPRVVDRYCRAALISQIRLLLQTWEPCTDLLRRLSSAELRLEEPLCWRRVPNNVALDVHAAELFDWSYDLGQVKEERKSRRGFDTAMKQPKISRSMWPCLKMVMRALGKLPGTLLLLLPQDVGPLLHRDATRELEEMGCTVEKYALKPEWWQLVSSEHSFVVVFVRDQSSWSLPAEPPVAERPGSSAPILILSIQELCVKINFPGLVRKVLHWLDEDAGLAQEEAGFWPLPQVLQINEFGVRAQQEHMRSKFGVHFRKVFTKTQEKLRQKRLPELMEAKKRAEAELHRQRIAWNDAEIVVAGLEKAVEKLDLEAFEEQLSKAKKLLGARKLQELQQRWDAALWAAEAPLRQLLELSLSSAPGELLELLGPLRRALVDAPLPGSSATLQGAVKLRKALEALERLQTGGTELSVASQCVESFESAMRQAQTPLRQLLRQCEGQVELLKSDQRLEKQLLSAPWARGRRLLAGLTTESYRQLEAAAAKASEACRGRLEEPLQEAFRAAEAGKQLRRAAQGSDEATLERCLREAELRGLSGLEGPRRALEELRRAKERLRQQLESLVEALELSRFDASASELGERERRELRERLVGALREEERLLQGLLAGGDVASIKEGLAKSRLPPGNRWRHVATASLAAADAAQKISEVLKTKPVDEALLQARLNVGRGCSKDLGNALQQAGEEMPGEQLDFAFKSLQRALDEGYLGLAGSQADQALESLLRPPWQERWEAIEPGDLRQLELQFQEATEEARERLGEEVRRALEVGRCAVDLSSALELNALPRLRALSARAAELRLVGLEKVSAKIERLSAAERRPSTADLQTPRCTHLIFLDLELTSGFYEFESEPKILEVAVIVTDKDMTELDRGHWVLGGFTREDLEALGDFHKANFRDAAPGGDFPPYEGLSGNGLFSDIMTSRLSLKEVEQAVYELVSRHCPEGECPLVGYSVQCDREVIKHEMPRLYRHLSHQIVDVSSFFTVGKLWMPHKTQLWERRSTTYNHRALNDAEDAVEALRWVRAKFFQPPARRPNGAVLLDRRLTST